MSRRKRLFLIRIVCINAEAVIRENNDDVGGITWDDGEDLFYEALSHDVDQFTRSEGIEVAKRTLLNRILRHQPLSEPLSQVVKECVEESNNLYSIYC